MSLLQFCEWLENTPVGAGIREGVWLFPMLNIAHVLGMTIAAGTVVYLDLRLLGFGLRQAPVSQVAKSLLPWTWGGFSVMFLSGMFLIFSEAVMLYGNWFFRIKLVLLALAGLNAWVFHRGVYRGISEWDMAPVAPFRARLAGAFSLTLWMAILAAGRAIPYLTK
jgi:hypothetical protein